MESISDLKIIWLKLNWIRKPTGWTITTFTTPLVIMHGDWLRLRSAWALLGHFRSQHFWKWAERAGDISERCWGSITTLRNFKNMHILRFRIVWWSRPVMHCPESIRRIIPSTLAVLSKALSKLWKWPRTQLWWNDNFVQWFCGIFKILQAPFLECPLAAQWLVIHVVWFQ